MQAELRDSRRTEARAHGAAKAVTGRSVLLGLLLASGLAAITPYNDYIIGNTYIAGSHFPVGAAAVLLLLSLINLVSGRVRGRSLLRPSEVGVIYSMVLVTSGIASSGLLRYLIPVTTDARYFASPSNQWQALFVNYIRPWVGMSDETAVVGLWEGLPSTAAMPWRAWASVLSHWLILVLSLWLMMISLSALVRRQWAERERLSFPLVQFPLEVLRDDGRGPSVSFFTNRLVWLGAGAVFVIHLVNGLHLVLPALPAIPTSFDPDQYLTDSPWDAIPPLGAQVFFSAVGFAYLLPLEVSAGFWSCFLLLKVQAVALRVLGYGGGEAGLDLIWRVAGGEQMGGLLAVAAALLWFLRGTFAEAFRNVIRQRRDTDDKAEPLSYRFAAIALVVSLTAAAVWLYAAGMTAPFIALFLIVFGCMCLVLTRIMAEAGNLMLQLSFSPTNYLLLLGGAGGPGPINLTVLTHVNTAFAWDMREFMMPSVLNAFRLSDLLGISSRSLTRVLAVALLVVLAVAIPSFLLTVCAQGALQVPHVNSLLLSRYSFDELGTRLLSPQPPARIDYFAGAAGAVAVAVLAWLRVNFVWWPIHPLGFVMATSYSSIMLWFSFFLGWLAKVIATRYGGLRGYVQIRPLFLGVIMGDVLGAVLWQVVGWFTGVGMRVTPG